MEKEFNLSELIFECGKSKASIDCPVIHKENVKEFIRLLKEDLYVPKDCDVGTALRTLLDRINKLAGNKLI